MHVNRARVRPEELIVWGKVNLAAILYTNDNDDLNDLEALDNSNDLNDSKISPIQQKTSAQSSLKLNLTYEILRRCKLQQHNCMCDTKNPHARRKNRYFLHDL